MSIAYYHGSLGGVARTFIPIPKEPETLSVEILNKIRQVFFKTYVEPKVDNFDIVTIDDVEVLIYYGTYNGSSCKNERQFWICRCNKKNRYCWNHI